MKQTRILVVVKIYFRTNFQSQVGCGYSNIDAIIFIDKVVKIKQLRFLQEIKVLTDNARTDARIAKELDRLVDTTNATQIHTHCLFRFVSNI